MQAFKNRLSKGQELTNDLVDYLVANDIPYFITGYEGLNTSGEARLNIINNNSITSLFVRHYPDLTLAFKHDSYLLEVKNSSGIEYECWQTYKKLHENLEVNVLFYLRDKKVYHIKDIVFEQMNEYCWKSNLEIPVLDNIWRVPKMLDDDKYVEYLKAYDYKTSGCSFAFIDFKKSIGYDKEVLKRISNINT
jgi:hypothetical protein